LIHDLSFPKANSINSAIPSEFTEVQYETLDHAIDLILAAGNKALMAKTDIENAYRIIPVNAASIPLLGMTCDNKLYFDAFLPFGLSQSCAIFETFSTSLQWILKRKSPNTLITHILDDFIFIGHANSPASQNGLSTFLNLATFLGIPVKHSKTVRPTTCTTLHGIEIDTVAAEARLPADKLAKGFAILTSLNKRKKATLKQLQEALGFLNFVCKVVTPGRAFMRRLTDLTRGLQAPHHYVRLSRAARADLSAWLSFLHHYNGVSLLRPIRWTSSPTIKLYSDSAASCGFAAILGSKWLAGPFPVTWKLLHISILELYPIMLAVSIWGHFLKNRCIKFFCDNINVVYALNSQSSQQPQLMTLIRRVVLSCLQHNILFMAEHVPGYQNVIPDLISRFQVPRAKQLAPWLDEMQTPIPEHLLPSTILLNAC